MKKAIIIDDGLFVSMRFFENYKVFS